jgi:hypothetical protein
MAAEILKSERKNTLEMTKFWLFEKMNKIKEPLARIRKSERRPEKIKSEIKLET